MKRYFMMGLITASALAAGTGFAMSERMPASEAIVADPAYALSADAKAMMIGNAEMKHAQETAHWGMLSLEMSKVAADKSTNPVVKQFAKFEMAEQETLADILDDTYPNMPKPSLLEDEKLMLDSMGRTKGANLDRMYVSLQIDAHERLQAVQEAYLKDGSYLNQRNVAKLAEGMIEQHLAVLKAAQMRK